MKITEITDNKRKYIQLLLLADEQEDMIDRYLDRGRMFLLDDNGVKCECVITDEGGGVLEIKNIATNPEDQGKGYARALIDYITGNFAKDYSVLQVGTGDSPLTIPFYEKCGFVRSHVIPDFFTDHYDHPIYEEGVLLKDMVYLKKSLNSNRFSRTELLIGKAGMERLSDCRVAVFGIGGVGGYVCEALARSGVGAFDLIDNDKVCLTNINRQIIATRKTVGKYKTDVMKERILDINPGAEVNTYQCFFLPENASDFPFDQYDYVVDAVDTVTAKIELVMQCQKKEIPIISSMGTGNKLDPTRFRVADIYETQMDPLAKVMRHELKKRGVGKLKVVYSQEQPVKPAGAAANMETGCPKRRSTPGSTAFVPPVAGLIIAGEVIKDLTHKVEITKMSETTGKKRIDS